MEISMQNQWEEQEVLNPFDSLPTELLLKVCSYLPAASDRFSFYTTCRAMHTSEIAGRISHTLRIDLSSRHQANERLARFPPVPKLSKLCISRGTVGPSLAFDLEPVSNSELLSLLQDFRCRTSPPSLHDVQELHLSENVRLQGSMADSAELETSLLRLADILRTSCPHLSSLTIADKGAHDYLLLNLAIPDERPVLPLTSLHLSEGYGRARYSTMAAFPHLKRLSFHCNRWRADDGASNLSSLEHLEDLTLYSRTSSDTPEGLEQAIKGCTRLTHLNLQGPVRFARPFESSSLRHLVIKEIGGIQCLSHLALSQLPAIESIEVDQLSITAEERAPSAQAMEMWARLAMKHTRFSGVLIRNVEVEMVLHLLVSLGGWLLDEVTWLKCDKVVLYEPRALALLADLLPGLRVLELSSCAFWDLECLSGVLTEVARMPHLRSLTVCPDLGPEPAPLPFPSHLVVSQSLRSLTLEFFHIGGGVLRLMSELFPYVEELNLRSCTFVPTMVKEANACFQYLRAPVTWETAAMKKHDVAQEGLW